MKFIKLTYYDFNKSYPEKSKCTNKEFYLKADSISRLTSYIPMNTESKKTSPHPSTKIVLENGEIVEVCQSMDEIVLMLSSVGKLEK